jgi:hypothetical protein
MRVHFLRLSVVALAGVALACGKSDVSKSKQRSKPDASVAPKEEPLKLEAFWDDPSYTVIGDQAPCPEGWWALFGGDPPGETKEEQKANLAKKPELKKALEAKTFIVHLQSGDEVTLGDYSNARGELDINVKASVLCKSPSLENVAIAFGPVKAMLPPGRDFGQYFWLGDPVKYPIKLPFSQLAEFKNKHRDGGGEGGAPEARHPQPRGRDGRLGRRVGDARQHQGRAAGGGPRPHRAGGHPPLIDGRRCMRHRSGV